MSKLEAYKQAEAPLPASYQAWQVFGAGLENVGRGGKPVTVDLREPNDDEVLLRVDVLGLCLSDMKIIAQGGGHPRLRGRDLANDPTVLGHECAATVVKAGKNWADQFKPGQRYIVQADIYVDGVGYAFGYLIPGGLQEYTMADARMLDGDEGCYLLPVQPQTGYSQAALAEPWACVEMSYCLEDGLQLAPKGSALVISNSPNEVDAPGIDKERTLQLPPEPDKLPYTAFDDIVIERPTPEIVNAAAQRLNKHGNLWLLGEPAGAGDVVLDVGAIHYENKRVFGGGADVAAVAQRNTRNDLLPGGTGLFIGAGGPMGQMHVQRAIEKEEGLKRVVVTDLDRGRLDHIERRFGPLAAGKDIELTLLAPAEFDSPQAMEARLAELAPGGYTDLVVLAPVPALVEQAVRLAAPNAFVNIFAGLPAGKTANIPLEKLCQGVKLIGCSGSRISDLRRVLALVEAEQLDTNRSVAAIGGLEAAHEGLKAVKDATYPGKTVIYTQIHGLPLTPLEELKDTLPGVAEHLSPEGAWTTEAEAALLEKYL